MLDKKVGNVVFCDRGYIIAEVVDGGRVSGFSLSGPHASDAIIYASRLQALDALQDIESRRVEG